MDLVKYLLLFRGYVQCVYTLSQDTNWNLDTNFSEPLVSLSNLKTKNLWQDTLADFLLKVLMEVFEDNRYQLQFLNQVVKDPVTEDYWASDRIFGLLKLTEGQFQAIVPVTPNNSAVFSVQSIGTQLYALRGGHDASYTQLSQLMQVDRLGLYGWSNVSYFTDPNSVLRSVNDVQVAVYNEATGKTFYGSHGYGLIEEYEPGEFIVYNETNSPLVNILDSGAFVRVLDLDLDPQGTLWIANYIESKSSSLAPVHSLDEDGNWNSYLIPDITGVGYPTKILADNEGNVWMTLDRKMVEEWWFLIPKMGNLLM